MHATLILIILQEDEVIVYSSVYVKIRLSLIET